MDEVTYGTLFRAFYLDHYQSLHIAVLVVSILIFLYSLAKGLYYDFKLKSIPSWKGFSRASGIFVVLYCATGTIVILSVQLVLIAFDSFVMPEQFGSQISNTVLFAFGGFIILLLSSLLLYRMWNDLFQPLPRLYKDLKRDYDL